MQTTDSTRLTLVAGTPERFVARSAAGILISSGAIPHFSLNRILDALKQADVDPESRAIVVGTLVRAAHDAEGR